MSELRALEFLQKTLNDARDLLHKGGFDSYDVSRLYTSVGVAMIQDCEAVNMALSMAIRANKPLVWQEMADSGIKFGAMNYNGSLYTVFCRKPGYWYARYNGVSLTTDGDYFIDLEGAQAACDLHYNLHKGDMHD